MTAHQAKPLSSVLVRTLACMQLPLMLAVVAILAVAWPADAGDTPCSQYPWEIRRGDGLRLIRVWACGYSNDDGVAERGRVVIATYRWVSGLEWYPVTSQTITLEAAFLHDFDKDPNVATRRFGKNYGNDKCRIGSPGGPIGCSVPNTHRVTFYSPAWNVDAKDEMRTDVGIVSWRDDQGFPHADIQVSVQSPTWDAK
jgi:hypothetical protein